MIWVYLNLVDITKAALPRNMSVRQVRKDHSVFEIFVGYESIKSREPPSQNTPLFFQKVLCICSLFKSHVRSLPIHFTPEDFGTFCSSRTGALYKWKIRIANSRFDKKPDLGWAIHQA